MDKFGRRQGGPLVNPVVRHGEDIIESFDFELQFSAKSWKIGSGDDDTGSEDPAT
jgi:hypothetical protein